MSLPRIQSLMTEIGPLVEELQSIHQVDECEWELLSGDRTGTLVSYEREARKLTFTVEIGQPSQEQRLTLYDMMLTYNGLGGLTDGVRLALDSPQGTVLLIFDLYSLDLDLPTFQTVLQNLWTKSALWTQLISTSPDSSRLEAAATTENSSDGVLRV